MRLRDVRAIVGTVERVLGKSEYSSSEYKAGAAFALELMRQSVENQAAWDRQRRAIRRKVRGELAARRAARRVG